jgi:HAE1 family hydrophobic/amphiphilic exporter-1
VTARQYEREGRVSRFSLDRRITVLVLFLTLLVVGAAAATRIPVELIPSGFDDLWLMVFVPWEDAPSKEVLDKLSIPLEEELSTIRGVDDVWTVSRTGRSMAFAKFKHGTDMDVAYREVRDRVERARRVFPEDIDRVYIRKDDASGIPVFVLGVAVDESVTDSYNLIQNEIILPLSRIDGVASVDSDGLVEKEILIELDRERTNSAGLNIYQLGQELGDDNFSMASGNVRDGSKKLLLRSVARFHDLEELKQRRVGPVRLGDIASVTYEQPERDFRVRAMSKPAIAVVVMKEGDANVREVSGNVAAVVEKFEQNPRLADVEMITLMSQGDIIDEALRTLLGSGMIGGCIAGIVLFLFLRRFRLTVIIALGIPLSLLIGLTVMYFSGESLNLLTLLGLMLCVGLLVDNSVVVAENIHRLHREGVERRQACVHGAGEVGLAITMSTLTTIVVFLPVALVGGPAQFFLLRLAIPVCVSVAASLLVALVFIPLCVYLTLPRTGNGRHKGALQVWHERLNVVLRRVYEGSFGRLNRLYNGFLTFFMERRTDLVLIVLGVFLLTAALPMQQVKFVDVQEEERHGFHIEVEMDQSSTLEETEEWFLQAEKVIEQNKEEWGLEGYFHFHRKTYGEIQAWFPTERTTDLTPQEVTERALDALPKKAGMKLIVSGENERGETEGASTFTVSINGEDYDQLEEIAEQLEELLVRVDGVLGVRGGNRRVPNEMALVIDRERAQQYGVNPQIIAGVVGYALRGTELPKFQAEGKEIPVRIRFQESDRESLTELADFRVPTADGAVLPVSALTRTEFLPSPRTIVRKDKRMERTITFELEEDREEEARERLALLVGAIDLPEGVGFAANRQQESLDEDLAAMRSAGLLSIVFIYLLMGFLFESFILPLSIVLTIPLSAIGVWWIHLLTGYDLDFLGAVAIVLLIGVVVNNGIVLVDYVNRLRNQGHSRREAILIATDRRFRPIMMTAITTIGGMVPLALAGANSIGLSYTSFSLTLIGGMTTATLLTLLVVPIFYTLFDDAREAFGAALKRALGREPAPPETEPARP